MENNNQSLFSLRLTIRRTKLDYVNSAENIMYRLQNWCYTCSNLSRVLSLATRETWFLWICALNRTGERERKRKREKGTLLCGRCKHDPSWLSLTHQPIIADLYVGQHCNDRHRKSTRWGVPCWWNKYLQYIYYAW